MLLIQTLKKNVGISYTVYSFIITFRYLSFVYGNGIFKVKSFSLNNTRICFR